MVVAVPTMPNFISLGACGSSILTGPWALIPNRMSTWRPDFPNSSSGLRVVGYSFWKQFNLGIGTDLFGDDFICIGSVFPMFVVDLKIHLKFNQTPEAEKRVAMPA